MNNTGWTLAIVALIIGGGLGYMACNVNDVNTGIGGTAGGSSDKKVALYTAMRGLWSDHVFWTREYITTFAEGNTPAATAAANRLMKNQEDIGAAVGQYYGADAGRQVTALLKEHIGIAVELLAAAKADDTAKFNDADARWKKNADDIATFLSSANPNWPEQALKDMMAEHLKTTTDEAVASLKKDYPASVAAFDMVFDHINKMSDALAGGIIAQFPDKFN